MPSKASTILLSAAVLAVASTTQTVDAFCPTTSIKSPKAAANTISPFALYAEETKESSSPDAVFMPLDSSEEEEEEEDVNLDTVEMLGRGAAKVGDGHYYCRLCHD
jgi:hypothetical protein